MIIDRVLNNNVVIIKDENGIEQVVCGKGIAFKKKSKMKTIDKIKNLYYNKKRFSRMVIVKSS